MPLPSQVLFEECPAKNVLWGGQAGPGKSHGARWWLYKRSLMVPGHEALLTRENWDQLEKTHLRKMAAELPLFGAKLVDKTARFPNGSFIDCGHMADVEAVGRYLSTEYGAIVCDEATRTPVDSEGITPLSELSTRARKVYRDVQGVEVRPRFMPVSNPGGPSAAYLRDMFVDGTPDFERYPNLRPVFGEDGGQTKGYRRDAWQYIPARLDDNPYQDPEYEDTLAVLDSVRYEQLRHGDWHVSSGQFFRQWRELVHVRRLDLPKGVEFFCSMDWGYNAPGVVLWWACLPDGKYHVARELKFQQKTAEAVASEWKDVNRGLGNPRVRYVAADPSMWAKTGHGRGESIAETLLRLGLPMRRADNDRKNGWQRCHELLRVAPDGTPWVTVDERCVYGRRSVPAQQSDRKDPDDIDTGGDDHWVDAWRYGAMSRPSPTQIMRTQTVVPGTAGALRAALLAGTRRVLGADNVRSA